VIIFETSRLIVRRYDASDVEDFYLLNSDPDVMRYIRQPKTFEESRQFLLENIAFYDKHPQFGRFAVNEKGSGNFAGSFAIIPLDHTNHWQVGYALMKPYWGKGYATELVRSGLDYAFTICGLEYLAGVTEILNDDSQKVLLKAGFFYEKNFIEGVKELKLFSMTPCPPKGGT